MRQLKYLTLQKATFNKENIFDSRKQVDSKQYNFLPYVSDIFVFLK